MRRNLPIMFAVTAFVTSTAIADWPQIIVHEHSLAYNYPGSKYELISHSVPSSNDGGAVITAVPDGEFSDDEVKAASLPKIRVHEHSLAYNYPGSEYELILHSVPSSNDRADVGKNTLDKEHFGDEMKASGLPKIRVHEHSLAYNYPGSEYELISHSVPSLNDKGDVGRATRAKEDLNNEIRAPSLPKIRVHEHSLAYNYPGSEYELISHSGPSSNDEGESEKTMPKDHEAHNAGNKNEQSIYLNNYK